MALGRKTGGRRVGSRNKVTPAVRELALAFTSEAVDRLVFWMRSDDVRASVSATIALLDRGHGKPKELHEHTGKDGGPIQVHDHFSLPAAS